ncbi:xylulokinase, partial [Cellulomonas septica]|nr:xylulokinase [Cellulomonas septica]
MGVVAGVDSSTQSCTVELRDAESGRLLGSGRSPHPPTSPPVSEQDPATWWEAF